MFEFTDEELIILYLTNTGLSSNEIENIYKDEQWLDNAQEQQYKFYMQQSFLVIGNYVGVHDNVKLELLYSYQATLLASHMCGLAQQETQLKANTSNGAIKQISSNGRSVVFADISTIYGESSASADAIIPNNIKMMLPRVRVW